MTHETRRAVQSLALAIVWQVVGIAVGAFTLWQLVAPALVDARVRVVVEREYAPAKALDVAQLRAEIELVNRMQDQRIETLAGEDKVLREEAAARERAIQTRLDQILQLLVTMQRRP